MVLDEDPKKRISNYHPTHEMQYGEIAATLLLREWLSCRSSTTGMTSIGARKHAKIFSRFGLLLEAKLNIRPMSDFRITATASRRCSTSKSGTPNSPHRICQENCLRRSKKLPLADMSFCTSAGLSGLPASSTRTRTNEHLQPTLVSSNKS